MKNLKVVTILISINPKDKFNPNILVDSTGKLPTAEILGLTINDQADKLIVDSLQVNIEPNWLKKELKTIVEDADSIYMVYKSYFPWIIKIGDSGFTWQSIYVAGSNEYNKKFLEGK